MGGVDIVKELANATKLPEDKAKALAGKLLGSVESVSPEEVKKALKAAVPDLEEWKKLSDEHIDKGADSKKEDAPSAASSAPLKFVQAAVAAVKEKVEGATPITSKAQMTDVLKKLGAEEPEEKAGGVSAAMCTFLKANMPDSAFQAASKLMPWMAGDEDKDKDSKAEATEETAAAGAAAGGKNTVEELMKEVKEGDVAGALEVTKGMATEALDSFDGASSSPSSPSKKSKFSMHGLKSMFKKMLSPSKKDKQAEEGEGAGVETTEAAIQTAAADATEKATEATTSMQTAAAGATEKATEATTSMQTAAADATKKASDKATKKATSIQTAAADATEKATETPQLATSS